MHKLLVARRRQAAWQAKRDKDLRQAAQLIALLQEARPGDVDAARAAIDRRGPSWRRALEGGLRCASIAL